MARRQPNQTLTSGTQVDSVSETSQTAQVTGTLRLRGERTTTLTQQQEHRASGRRIRWEADVIDNEGMGKKNSKVCCIYHKPRAMNESSSESDSDPSSSSSDIDSGDSDTSDIDVDGRRRQQQQHNDSHGENGAATTHADGHSHGCNDLEPSSHHHHIKTPSRKPKRKSKKRKPSPNAYERVSKNVK
jgi:protein phosphatase 1 regulatory subunit 11